MSGNYMRHVRKRYGDMRWANWRANRNQLPMYGPTREWAKALRMISWRRW